MNVELPDGTVIEDVPEGTTQAALMARVGKMRGTPAPAPAAPKTAVETRKATLSTADALDKTGNEAFVEVPRTALQNTLAKIASGYAGLTGTALPGKPGQGKRFQEATEEGLSYSPKNPASRAILTALGLPAAGVEWLGEKAGSKIAEKGAPATGAIVKGAAEAAPMLFGLRSFKYAPPPVVSLARERGFKLTPSEGGAGVVGKTVEGLSGEEKISKAISGKNAEAAARAVAKDIGIADGVPLTRESIAAARRQAHAAYEEARGLGEIQTSANYLKALDEIEAQYKNAAKSFPKGQSKVAQEVMQAVEGHRVKAFDASAAVDEIKALREAANREYAGGDPALGKAYKGIAKALEEQFVEHVEALGKNQPALLAPHRGLVERLRGARERIAKTYEADKVLDKDGAINPQKFAQMEKRAPGKLTGAAKDIAKLAEDAPRSFRKDAGGNALFPTWADAMMAGLTGAAEGAAHGIYSGGAAVPLALVARPATRALMTSEPYQAFQASPVPGAIGYASPMASLIAQVAKEEADKTAKKEKRQ